MSAPTILLINPWIYDFAAYDLWIKPIGLLSIADLLKKNGVGTYFIDCLTSDHPSMTENPNLKQPSHKVTGQGHFYKKEIPKPKTLKSIIRKYSRYGILPSVFDNELNSIPPPQAVLITSMMTYWYPGVFEVIKKVKSIYPRIPILLGGVYVTLCPHHARLNSGANRIFVGHCNRKFFKTLEDITGRPLNLPDVDFFTYPDYELMLSKNYIPLLSSRGCPYRCSYCASALLYPNFRQCNPQSIVNVIEYWVQKAGTLDFVFYDDALLINSKKHFVPMMQEVLERALPVRFHVPNGLHIRNIDHTVAELMMRTGFKTLRLGLESVDPQLQKKTGYKVTAKEFINAATALKDVGFTSKEVGVYVFAGLPKQTFQSAYDTIRFVQDQNFRPLVAEYSPIPGTPLWKEAVACSPFPITEEPLFHNNTLLPCQWEKFTLDDLNFLKQESRKKFYK